MMDTKNTVNKNTVNKNTVSNNLHDVKDFLAVDNNTNLQEKKTNIAAYNFQAIQSYEEVITYMKEHNIKISTMTIDCKIGTLIDIDLFARYVILREGEIVSVKFGDRTNPATNRTIICQKPKKKPSKRNFFNQVTILMKPSNNLQRNYINIKVFKNGSLHMTGCKDLDDFRSVALNLIEILKRGRNIDKKKFKPINPTVYKSNATKTKQYYQGIITHLNDGKTLNLNFVKEPNKMMVSNISVRMINSNFKYPHKIDRKTLASVLRKNHGPFPIDPEFGHIKFKYRPNGGHACVNIKYQYDEKNIPSIFVFQTGSIIITGAKKLYHITSAYQFINKLLDKYIKQIRIVELNPINIQKDIVAFFERKKNCE